MTDRISPTVLDILRREPAGRLLDVPAGDSPVADGARSMGHRVIGLDLFPTPRPDVVQGDACAPFPFGDGAFDTLLSLEGIEHFENQTGFLRECARVLRPGGRMVLTTPNVLHLSGRMSHFWTGQRKMKRGFVNIDTTLRERDGDRIYHGHAFLIDVFRLCYLMDVVGLELETVHRGRRSTGSYALAPLVPLVWLSTSMALASGKRTYEKEGRRPMQPETSERIRSLANSWNLLTSRTLIVSARKRTTGEDPG